MRRAMLVSAALIWLLVACSAEPEAIATVEVVAAVEAPAEVESTAVSVSGPYLPFETGDSLPFSAEDGMVLVQAQLNTLLPSFYGHVDPEIGFQLSEVRVEPLRLTEDKDSVAADFEIVFGATRQDQPVMLAGPAYFRWQRLDETGWEMQAGADLTIDNDGMTVSMVMAIAGNSLREESYQIHEDTSVQYPVAAEYWSLASRTTTVYTRQSEAEITTTTEQEASISAGPDQIYTESNSNAVNQRFYSPNVLEFSFDTATESSRGYRQGRGHQTATHFDDRLEVMVDELELATGEGMMRLVGPSRVILEQGETGDDRDLFILTWNPIFQTGSGTYNPGLAAEFVMWEEGGKAYLAEHALLDIPELGYSQEQRFILDPPARWGTFLFRKTYMTAIGALSGGLGGATLSSPTAVVPPAGAVVIPASAITGAVYGGLLGDVGYIVSGGSDLINPGVDYTTPHCRLEDTAADWSVTFRDEDMVMGFEATITVACSDSESGVSGLEIGINDEWQAATLPETLPEASGKYLIRLPYQSTPLVTGPVRVRATNGDGQTGQTMLPSQTFALTDTQGPAVFAPRFQSAGFGESGCFYVHYLVDISDTQSGIRSVEFSVPDGVRAIPVGLANETGWGLVSSAQLVTVAGCAFPYVTPAFNLTVIAQDMAGNQAQVALPIPQRVP